MTACRHMICEPASECQIVPAEDLVEGISAALRAEDMPAVVALLERLALIDPGQAQLVLVTIQTGLQLASGT